MFNSLPDVVKFIVISGIAVLAILFSILLIKTVLKISGKIIKNSPLPLRLKKRNRSGFKFGIFTYWLVKKKFKLNFHEMNTLRKVFFKTKIPSARVLLISPEMSFFYFRQYFELLQNSRMQKDEIHFLQDEVIALCPKFSTMPERITSTRFIPLNTPVTIISEFGGKFASQIVDVNSKHLLVSIPQMTEKQISALEDMILTITLNNVNDAGYDFSTFVMGRKQIGNVTFFMLAHTNKIARKQKRKSSRKECKFQAVLYLVSLYHAEGKEKVMLHKSTMTGAYVKNLSAGGMCLLTKATDFTEAGKILKIDLKLNGSNESIVAKIKRVRYIHNKQQCYIHLEILRQAPATRRNIETFVFDIHPDFMNNVSTKTEQKAAISREEHAINLLKKHPLISRVRSR